MIIALFHSYFFWMTFGIDLLFVFNYRTLIFGWENMTTRPEVLTTPHATHNQEEVSMGGVPFKNMKKKLKFNGVRLSSLRTPKIRIFPSKYFYITFRDHSCKLTSDWWLYSDWNQRLVVLFVDLRSFSFSFGFIGELIEFCWVMFWNIK